MDATALEPGISNDLLWEKMTDALAVAGLVDVVGADVMPGSDDFSPMDSHIR